MPKKREWTQEEWDKFFEEVTETIFEDWLEGIEVGSTIDNMFSEHEDALKAYFEVDESEEEDGD